MSQNVGGRLRNSDGSVVSLPAVNITRITTIGADVVVSAAPAVLLGIVGEAASTTAVTLKDNATTIGVLAAGAIPLAGGVNFQGAKFNTNLTVNIGATGQNLIVLWNPQ